MQEKYGKDNFYITPDTFLLPDEEEEFWDYFEDITKLEGWKSLWIVKPNASS